MLEHSLPHPALQTSAPATGELELLLCCARTVRDAATLKRAAELLAQQISWDRVLEQASRHRILPLLYLNLSRLEWEGVPAAVRSELHSRQQSNAADALGLAGELLRLLDSLGRHGIRAIPFKGVTLAARAYRDVALRDAGDIDLLVRRQQIVEAVKLLESSGHRPVFPTSTAAESQYLRRLSGPRREDYLLSHCEHHLVREEGRVNVDLHWAITLREFCLPLNTEGLWQRATTLSLAGREVPVLRDEDLLLVLCVNGAKDCWERLDRVCDVHELIGAAPGLDWERVIDLARRSGAQRMVRLGLALASHLLGATLPSSVETYLHGDPHLTVLVAEVRDSLLGSAGLTLDTRSSRAMFHLRLRERWRDRAQYCAAHLRPGVGDWAGVPLPPALGFLHYVLRPFRLAARYCFKPTGAPPADRPSVF